MGEAFHKMAFETRFEAPRFYLSWTHFRDVCGFVLLISFPILVFASLQLPSSESSCSVTSNGEGLMDLALKLVRYLLWSKFSFRSSLTLNYTGYYSCILLTSSTQHQIRCFEGVDSFHSGGVCFNSLHYYSLIIGVFSITITLDC